tara:strand:+ start:743 stop:958 length:216 start_codon:yes stop_codon:yes gene_type:complete
LNNLLFTVGADKARGVTGRQAFVEIQIHQRQIRAFNEEKHAHDHYDFFRSLLGGSYASTAPCPSRWLRPSL